MRKKLIMLALGLAALAATIVPAGPALAAAPTYTCYAAGNPYGPISAKDKHTYVKAGYTCTRNT
jgi:hypothetical protein